MKIFPIITDSPTFLNGQTISTDDGEWLASWREKKTGGYSVWSDRAGGLGMGFYETEQGVVDEMCRRAILIRMTK